MKRVLLALSFIFVTTLPALSAPLQWSGNNHYYDLIFFQPNPTRTWQESLVDANSLTFNNIPGHLATITSAEENQFLLSNFGTSLDNQFAWIAGYEPNDNGVWKWATGAESGVQFSNVKNPTAPFNYANWGGAEPNDHKPGEDFAMYNIGNTFAGIQPGQWADAINTSNQLDPVVASLVEYDPTFTVTPEPVSSLLFLAGGGVLLGDMLRRRKLIKP